MRHLTAPRIAAMQRSDGRASARYPGNWRAPVVLSAQTHATAMPGGGVMPKACFQHDDARQRFTPRSRAWGVNDG
jgi:hypothetical protein